jgi:thioredoxin 1
MPVQNITLDKLPTMLGNGDVVLLTYSGSIQKKLSKALKSISDRHQVATIDVSTDNHAVETLDLHESGNMLLVFEDGEEIGRLYRVKPKEIYDYASFLEGKGPQPEDRTVDEKPSIGGNTVARPMHITQRNFKQAVLKSNVPVLVDMWAPWCGPCNVIAPVIEKIAAEYDGKLKVAKINVDDNQRLARKYGVMSIPTMLIFQNGKEVDRMVGALPEFAIRDHLKAFI